MAYLLNLDRIIGMYIETIPSLNYNYIYERVRCAKILQHHM